VREDMNEIKQRLGDLELKMAGEFSSIGMNPDKMDNILLMIKDKRKEGRNGHHARSLICGIRQDVLVFLNSIVRCSISTCLYWHSSARLCFCRRSSFNFLFLLKEIQSSRKAMRSPSCSASSKRSQA
jgi:hypothetical protein